MYFITLKHIKIMNLNLLLQFKRIVMFTVYGFFMQVLLCSVLLASGTTNAQKVVSVKEVSVNMNFENEVITSVFNKIRNSYGYKFVYDNKDLDKKLNLNWQYQDDLFYDVLVDISKKTNLGFRQVNNTITVKKLELQTQNPVEVSFVNVVEDISISGKVIDENADPLPGVNVLIDGIALGVVANLEGDYKITVPVSGSVLVFSFVGYINQQLTVGSQNVMDISMVPDISALDEVIVTALGIKREERTLGYSVSQLDGKDIASNHCQSNCCSARESPWSSNQHNIRGNIWWSQDCIAW
jgi:TonB-dependent starch-binding outer membrane protein SusC